MIVRIPGSGQFEVPERYVAELNDIDQALTDAVDAADQAGFEAGLAGLLARVREVGSPLSPETLLPSDVVLPPPDSTLAEVQALLGDEGLIPG